MMQKKKLILKQLLTYNVSVIREFAAWLLDQHIEFLEITEWVFLNQFRNEKNFLCLDFCFSKHSMIRLNNEFLQLQLFLKEAGRMQQVGGIYSNDSTALTTLQTWTGITF